MNGENNVALVTHSIGLTDDEMRGVAGEDLRVHDVTTEPLDQRAVVVALLHRERERDAAVST